MSETNIVVQTLRSLGLTRAEAETYLALVLHGAREPVSAYHVAQVMGKDPANLSKTLIALERVGAVRAIQDKPRLYVPIDPRQFTENLMVSMKEQSRRVMEQFQELRPVLPRGVPMALGSLQQALEKSAELLTQCRGELLIFADTRLLTRLGTSLEALAASSEVAVRLISHESFVMPGVENRILPAAGTFGTPDVEPWLQLVIDRSTWLTASFPSDGADNGPVGWWCTDPLVAAVMGASLAAAFHNASMGKATPGLLPTPEGSTLVFEGSMPVTEIPSDAVAEVAEIFAEEKVGVEADEKSAERFESAPPAPAQEKDPAPVLTEEGEEEEDEGLTFLIQHEEDEERNL